MFANMPVFASLPQWRPVLDLLAVPACLWNLENEIVAANPPAFATWQVENGNASPGFFAVRHHGGAAWKRWDLSGELAPQNFVGECKNGARVEYRSFPAVIRNAAGGPEGVFEAFLPLSEATVPRSMRHDLTNVVGVVLGNADLALMELPSENDLAENLREIRTAALHAREVLRGAATVLPESNRDLPPPRPRVLWIDDDEAFLLLAGRALQRLGCEVRTFFSPEEALENYASDSQGWDLIAIDNNLLGRDGVDVARQFLHINSAQDICIASGAVDESLEARAGECGVCRVISKPATVPEFAQSLGSLLARPIPPPGPP